MKTGYVKLSVPEYDALMIGNYTKSRQLERMEERIAEMQEALREKSNAVDNLARTQKHTVEFLEAVSPKMEKEWRAYIELVEEDEK